MIPGCLPSRRVSQAATIIVIVEFIDAFGWFIESFVRKDVKEDKFDLIIMDALDPDKFVAIVGSSRAQETAHCCCKDKQKECDKYPLLGSNFVNIPLSHLKAQKLFTAQVISKNSILAID
jgi:hypothetical protein